MENYIENIRQYILSNKKPSYQTTNKKEIRVRCPYCGDSKSNKSSAHFYIEMQPPFRFHCFKCETSGMLTQSVLRDLELYDSNLDIIKANKEQRSNSGVQKISMKKRKILNTFIESELSQFNLSYICNRFQRNFDPVILQSKYKVILDPIHFFEENKLYMPNNQFDYSKAIGFISSDNAYAVFRDTSGTQGKRYNNTVLYGDNLDIISKTYTISNEIDIMADSVDLIISEGIFDIIGVNSFLYEGNETNKIFAAACGKAYNAVILNYIRMGFLNLNIIIYSDGDVPVSFYKEMKNSSPYLRNNRITIYYNKAYNSVTGENKDFGIPLQDVQLTKVVI